LGVLDKFKLTYEDIDKERVKMVKKKQDSTKIKDIIKKEPTALGIDIRSYINPKKLGFAIEFCTFKGAKTAILTFAIFETVVQFKRVKR
jgi:hypothetical protein